MNLGDYARAIVAAVGATAGAFTTALADNRLTIEESGTILVTIIVAFGLVFGLSSTTVANVKVVIAALVALGATVVTAYADKTITGEEWGYVVGAVFAVAAAVKLTINSPTSIDHDSLVRVGAPALTSETPPIEGA